jgi:hypothetical protein
MESPIIYLCLQEIQFHWKFLLPNLEELSSFHGNYFSRKRIAYEDGIYIYIFEMIHSFDRSRNPFRRDSRMRGSRNRHRSNPRRPKTLEELDAEMDSYMATEREILPSGAPVSY